LDVALRIANTVADWFLENPLNYEQNLALNTHLGAEGAVSPERVQDPEGAKTLVVIYRTTSGATTTIIKRRFQVTCYIEPDTGRLRVDPAFTTGIIRGSHTGAKKNLIYDAFVHPQSDLDP
jgi:hypothetical protein